LSFQKKNVKNTSFATRNPFPYKVAANVNMCSSADAAQDSVLH
jgi:hypothetical protein